MSINVNIGPDIKLLSTGVSLGVITYKVNELNQSQDAFKEKFMSLKKQLSEYYLTKKIAEQKEIKAWRVLLKQMGVDYSRYRPSAEALIKRTISDKPLFWVNVAVDINNYLSVEHAIPMGIYDLDKIKGNIVYDLGSEDARYEALNGREVSFKGKPNLSDEIGSFGSPLVDSQRTKVTNDSKNLLHILYFYPGISESEIELIVQKSIELFTNELEVNILDKKLVK
ncbi:hypothetical protein BHT94_20840 [Bacillus licheniformis]|nr:hypothetical protein BHT94_20840 [Bacillus licheniformis]